MKNYVKINRLNEDHEKEMPTEILSMSVGQLLDSMNKLDSESDAEYEMIETALIALKDKIMMADSGYESTEELDIEQPVENDGPLGNEISVEDDEDDEFPSMERSNSDTNKDGANDTSFDSFKFD